MITRHAIDRDVGTGGRARVTVVAGLALAAYLLAFSVAFFVTTIRDFLLVDRPGFTNRVGLGVGTDFPSVYAVALETRAGRAGEMYDPDRFQAAHERVRGVPVYRYNWAYPPTFFLFLLPLSFLPLVPALWTWLGVTIGALMAGAYAL